MSSHFPLVTGKDYADFIPRGLYADMSGEETYYGRDNVTKNQVDTYAHDSMCIPANDGSYHGSGMMASKGTSGQVLRANSEGLHPTWGNLTDLKTDPALLEQLRSLAGCESAAVGLTNAGPVNGYAITAAPVIHGHIQIRGNHGQEIMRIEHDGNVKIGQGVTVDQASQEFYDRLLAHGSGHAETVLRLHAEVASLKAELAAADDYIFALLNQLSTELIELEPTVDPMTAYDRAMKGV